jgi:hypothetical protein
MAPSCHKTWSFSEVYVVAIAINAGKLIQLSMGTLNPAHVSGSKRRERAVSTRLPKRIIIHHRK